MGRGKLCEPCAPIFSIFFFTGAVVWRVRASSYDAWASGCGGDVVGEIASSSDEICDERVSVGVPCHC
jgi:hypothetical protein